MEMITGQLRYVGASFLWGIILLFFYDFILAARQRFRHRKVWILAEDWLFWIIAALFVFQMIFELNNGLIRNFFVIAFITGMCVYRKLVKKHVQMGIISFFRMFFRPYVWIGEKIRKIRKKILKS